MEWEFGRGNQSTRRKPAPVPLCSPQIPHNLSWARTRAVAVGSWRLTAWAMAWHLWFVVNALKLESTAIIITECYKLKIKIKISIQDFMSICDFTTSALTVFVKNLVH
jgi:hypothetical protein